MAEGSLIFFVFKPVAVLFYCYLLTRYWFRAGRYTPVNDAGKLRFGSKTAFAMTHFWNAVDDAKELPIESVKGGMGSVCLDSAEEIKREGRSDWLQ